MDDLDTPRRHQHWPTIASRCGFPGGEREYGVICDLCSDEAQDYVYCESLADRGFPRILFDGDTLQARIDAALALHYCRKDGIDGFDPFCDYDLNDWPCPTVAALTAKAQS